MDSHEFFSYQIIATLHQGMQISKRTCDWLYPKLDQGNVELDSMEKDRDIQIQTLRVLNQMPMPSQQKKYLPSTLGFWNARIQQFHHPYNQGYDKRPVVFTAQVSISCFSSTISSSHAVLHFLGKTASMEAERKGSTRHSVERGAFWRNLLCGNTRNATFWAVRVPWAPKTMKKQWFWAT